jgi:hypothetical protein
MSEQDKEMEAAAHNHTECVFRATQRGWPAHAIKVKDAFKAGWKAASERKDACIKELILLNIEGMNTILNGVNELQSLQSKLATALEALEMIGENDAAYAPAFKRAREALALIRGEK